MKKKQFNIAYIDGANLHNAIKTYNWIFDYERFRIWLLEKYSVLKAYIFIGYIEKNKELYSFLERIGYILIFKEITYQNKNIKGNCDANLVVKVMEDVYENVFDKIIIVSSDGDFNPLINFLIKKSKLEILLSPYRTSQCSFLLKKTQAKIAYVFDQKTILQKEKAPNEDRTS